MFHHPLTIFIAVADTRNFTKAAGQLNMTQPAVSQSIKNLEEVYGAKLFERTRQLVTLTYAGEVLLKFAKQIVALHKDSVTAVKDASSRPAPIIVGASRTIGEYLLPRLVAIGKKQHEPMAIQVRIGNTEEMIAALVDNLVDVALVEGEVSQSQLKMEPFLEDELVFIVSAHHPLAAKPLISAVDLHRETFILREPGSGTRKLAEDTLNRHGVEWSAGNVLEIASTQAIKEFAENGLGIAVLSASTVVKELERGQLQRIHIEGIRMTRYFRWVSKPDKYPFHTLARFKEIVFNML